MCSENWGKPISAAVWNLRRNTCLPLIAEPDGVDASDSGGLRSNRTQTLRVTLRVLYSSPLLYRQPALEGHEEIMTITELGCRKTGTTIDTPATSS
ncbi:hypothetical protein BSY15_1444 [Acidovorax sp. RAC01]|nr:hypothetical protein BSY15_1444 [Acidovorax sp. RAC01]